MREAWRALSDRAAAGYWVMVIARPAIVGAGAADVAPDLETALAAAGVIR
jgi:hypothetical protein